MTANETWATAFSVALLTSVEAAKFLNITRSSRRVQGARLDFLIVALVAKAHGKANVHRLALDLRLTRVRRRRDFIDAQRCRAKCKRPDEFGSDLRGHLTDRRGGTAERFAEQVRVFVEHSLKPASVGVFQRTQPVRLAGKFRADRLDHLGVVEEGQKGCPDRAAGSRRETQCAGSLAPARA